MFRRVILDFRMTSQLYVIVFGHVRINPNLGPWVQVPLEEEEVGTSVFYFSQSSNG